MAKKPKDAEPDGTKDKKSKGKKPGGRRGGKGEPHTDDGASVANHPRASAHVRAAKGWGGLVCFLAAGGLSLAAHDPAFQALLQALIAGVIGCLIGWGCSVMIWRQILVAEQRYHADKLRERWEEERRQRAEAAAAEVKQTARQK
jgi:predicted lipid-binding transport protein (Tim44 family)